MRVVFEMHLTYSLLSEPFNLAFDAEAAGGGITDVVVDRHGLGLASFYDSYVIFGGDGVLDTQDDSGFLGLWSDLAERVADVLLLSGRFQGTSAEERQQHYLGLKGLREPDPIDHPFLPK